MNTSRLRPPLLLILLPFLCGTIPLRAQHPPKADPIPVHGSGNLITATHTSPDSESPPLSPPPVSWINSHSPILQSHASQTLKPFYHGVASGDPLTNNVIIWTRVTPEKHGRIYVRWFMALDTGMQSIVADGTVETGPERDYTVKVDVAGLQPGTTYYYAFSALGRTSIVGRTKTAPVGSVDQLRFAVASCTNYQHGYFNAYDRISERNDLDAVLFLGDYLYEDGPDDDDYGPLPGRTHEPATTLTQLDEYRKRHSFYKLEPSLRRLHQQHPFIAIWDDHEMTDDCFSEGGKEHSDGRDGEWLWRRSAALRAYFEWMPVRERHEGKAYQIFRKFTYGDLADIIMLDTRLEGRAEQVADASDPDLYDPSRSMLGTSQRDWFLTQLEESTARWKIIGNQVVMAQVRGVKNMDAWDGYPIERNQILNWIDRKHISNVLFLTGDVHITMAANITHNPFDPSLYDPTSGDGSLAVELITPSIASANMNELYGLPPRNTGALLAETATELLNRHVKTIELDSHGYFVLDLKASRAQADWYFVETIEHPSNNERWSSSWFTRNGWNRLEKGRHPAPGKTLSPPPAPLGFPLDHVLAVGKDSIPTDDTGQQSPPLRIQHVRNDDAGNGLTGKIDSGDSTR